MSGECEINMTHWEAAINELYQLYNACKERESQAVSEIIQRLKKRNVKFKLIVGNETTTLHLMCFHGNLGMVKLLAEMYGNAEAKDENQWTPLHQACLQGHLEIVQYLIDKQRCNSQCRDKDGSIPYDLAGFHYHTDIMNYFIACGLFTKADLLKSFKNISQLYQLYTAYKKRDLQSVTKSNFLLCGMNVKFVLKDTNCATTLHLMCKFGNLDMVKNLVAMYGNVEARDEKGRTPLHIACESGCIDVVEYLISHCGCNKEAKNKWQFTPLHLACANGHNDIIEYLINQCGCDREARNEEQYTPLFIACLEGQTNTVKYLVSRFRCKVDIRNYTGKTPLHAACRYGFTELVQYLISDCGCSPEVKDEVAQATPLHFACVGGHFEIVKYLASECKCNTEVRDKYNHTPLYLASTFQGQSLLPLLFVRSSEYACGKRQCNINTKIATYLLFEQDCDPLAQALDGTSPIFNFYCIGELNMIKYCVKLKKHDPKTQKFCLYVFETQPDFSQDSSYIVMSPETRKLHLYFSETQPDFSQDSSYIIMSPLNVVCHMDNMDLIKFLVEECGADPMEKSEYLTPLEVACIHGRLDILQCLISKCGRVVSHHYYDLMFFACSFRRSEIMKYLLKYNSPHTLYAHGDTLLHIAAERQAYEIVKLLIDEGYDLDQRNYKGETALHKACHCCLWSTNIIKLLLSSGCNPQISNFAGKTPLWVIENSKDLVYKIRIFMPYLPSDVCERIFSDDIDEKESLELLQCLIREHNWNPNDKTKDRDTALHLACKTDRLTIIKYLFSIKDFKYDPYIKNKFNQTPIELTSSKEVIRELIKHGSNPIDVITNLITNEEQVLQLVKENKERLNGTTANDNNALHLACLTDRVTIVRYLLSESKIDVNAKNKSDISPIQLTKNSEIIRELIRYGANPTDLYSYCQRILRESKPLQTTVKVFVLGDSNVGKSTLISSLKKEGWFSFFTRWSSTLTDDTESGHGIITHDFNSKYCGPVTIYDFVGKRLFHESQSDLLRETSHAPRVFLVVTNLSGSDEGIILNLQYWLSFLEETSSPDSKFKNHTIIIGSNIDKCRNEEKRKVKIVKHFLQDRVNDLLNVDYHDFIALDCRSHSSSNITNVRRCLAKLCIVARNPNSLAFNAHCFQVYIVDRFNERVAVSVHEILNKIRREEKDVDENDPLNFLPQNDFQLQNLCIELHNKSQILYLRDSTASKIDLENSWIIIDKVALTSQLLEAFESKIFSRVPSDNGLLSFSTISELGPFKVYNTDMFVRFLCHLEYCKEISGWETLRAITNSASVGLTSERCFFFPALVENSAPEGIWNDHSGNFSYHCGWILQCTNSEQFFTSKFLQTLILRVMFCNTYLGTSGASILHTHLPRFTLWKGGVSWGNIFGAESLVEVLPNNKEVLYLMRSQDANLAKCMEHRSTIIHQIRQCAKEFCGNLKIRESLISPLLVKKYPICTTPSKLLYDVKPLAFAIVNITSIEKPYASSLTGTNMILIRDLLKFEPYIDLSALIIQEICNVDNPRYISCLTDDFLLHFTQQIRKNPLFVEMISLILNNHGIMDFSLDNLLYKLIEWRDTRHITYQQLHKCIDQFSIFAGLNILEIVPGLAMEEFSTPPSSPVLATRTVRRTTVSTTDSDNFTTTKDSSNNSHDIQLGDKPKLYRT